MGAQMTDDEADVLAWIIGIALLSVQEWLWRQF
jgi:hypothetical protein